MWFNKPKQAENIGKSIKELEAELAECHKVIEKMNSDMANCTPMIDFDNMRVFSIERMASKNRPSTIIGYYMEEPVLSNDGSLAVNRDVVHEWTLYINNERHEELVKKYVEWKQK